MSKVTQILSAIEQGDPSATEQLLPLVYDELRKLAARKMADEKPGQTPTRLVPWVNQIAQPPPSPDKKPRPSD